MAGEGKSEQVFESGTSPQQAAAGWSATATGSLSLPPERNVSSLEENGVRELLRNYDIKEIPQYYIKPESMRQHSSSVADADASQNFLPVIDLASPREELVKAMEKACELGFFQVVNHGSEPNLLERMLRESLEFFALPVEDKICCTTPQKVGGPIHFGGGSRGDWRDVLKITSAPASAVAMDFWPTRPASFRETFMQYSTAQQVLAKRLLEIISESLGLESDYIINECADPRVVSAINHYPPCPDPSLTMGIREHSDPTTITILQQTQVEGLQVYKDGLWFDVKPLEDALIVNAGDHLQILSNGKYSSCLHRVINNKTQSRTSIAIFFSPALTAYIKPAPALVDEKHPPQYAEFTYADFLKNFYNNGGPNKKSGSIHSLPGGCGLQSLSARPRGLVGSFNDPRTADDPPRDWMSSGTGRREF